MTGINSLIASYYWNYQAIWNERLDALENYVMRMIRDENKTDKNL